MYCLTLIYSDLSKFRQYGPSPEALEASINADTLCDSKVTQTTSQPCQPKHLIAWRIVNLGDGTVWAYHKDGEDLTNPIYKVKV